MTSLINSASGSTTLSGSAALQKIHTFVVSSTTRLSTSGAAQKWLPIETVVSGSSWRYYVWGRATVLAGVPYGSFRDFAHYTSAMPDPAQVLIKAKVSGRATLDAAQPSGMRRFWVTAAAPQDYPVSKGYAWRRAAFVSDGVRINALPANGTQLIDAAQVEITGNSTTGPSVYSPARSLQIKVHPDRLNYCVNPGFDLDVSGWSHAQGPTGTWDAGRDRVDWAVPSTTTASVVYPTTAINGVPGEVYSASADITVPEGFPPVTLRLIIRPYTSTGATLVDNLGIYYVTVLPGETQRVVWKATPLPATAASAKPIIQTWSGAILPAGTRFYLDNVVIEKTANTGPYFDGNSGEDYLWEGGGTGPAPRVDLMDSVPQYMATLKLKRTTVMQHAAKDPVTGDFYVTQTSSGTTASLETATISRVSAAGVLLDYMELTDGGHGTAIALQRINGKVNIWLCYQGAPSASAVTKGAGGNDLLRFEYAARTTPWTRDTIVATVMPKFGAGYVNVALDEATDTIAYRVSSGTSDTYQQRRLSDVLAGVNKRYGNVPLTQGTLPDGSTITMQGFATIDGELYRYTGDSNATTNPSLITRYSWATGQQTGQVSTADLGVNPDGTVAGNFREPEGISIYRDPVSGETSLIAGVTTGPVGGRIYTLFVYSPPDSVPGVWRSYYYRDRKARTYLLQRLLEENSPLGVIPGTPQFAVLPTQ